MNERLKELAEQAGFGYVAFPPLKGEWVCGDKALERFAELIRADEREACAKLCENVVSNEGYVQSKYCAKAIRQRGEQA